MKQKSLKKVKPTTESNFSSLKTKYKLTTPEQIQRKIIWHHIKAITLQLYGDTIENRAQLSKYDSHWGLCDEEINKRSRKPLDPLKKLTLTIIVIFSVFISHAQDAFKGYLSASGAVAFPIGEFASKDANSETSSMARVGTLCEVTFAHTFGEAAWGYAFSLRSGKFDFSSNDLKQELENQFGGHWSVSSGAYSWIAIYGGGYRTFAITETLFFDSRFMIGYFNTSFPNTTLLGTPSGQGATPVTGSLTSDDSGSFSYQIAGALRINIGARHAFIVGVDYFKATPEFNIESIAKAGSNTVANTYKSKRDISVVSLSVGFAFRVK